jgi:hypothetical protein
VDRSLIALGSPVNALRACIPAMLFTRRSFVRAIEATRGIRRSAIYTCVNSSAIYFTFM